MSRRRACRSSLLSRSTAKRDSPRPLPLPSSGQFLLRPPERPAKRQSALFDNLPPATRRSANLDESEAFFTNPPRRIERLTPIFTIMATYDRGAPPPRPRHQPYFVRHFRQFFSKCRFLTNRRQYFRRLGKPPKKYVYFNMSIFPLTRFRFSPKVQE